MEAQRIEQTEQRMKRAKGGQPFNLNAWKHGQTALDRRLRAVGWRTIDGRTAEGKEALAFRDEAIKAKGGDACPFHVRLEIKLATFDLFRLLHLQAYLIADTNRRGTPVNRRRRVLSPLHQQYSVIEQRFNSRFEKLNLKAPKLDLARQIQLEQLQKQQTNGN